MNKSWQEQEPSASAMTAAVQLHKSRKRKGSLRKTALLGTGKLKLERRSSNLDRHAEMVTPSSPTHVRKASDFSRDIRRPSDESADTETTSHQRFSFEDDTGLVDAEASDNDSSAGRHPDAQDSLTLDTSDRSEGSQISPPIIHTSHMSNLRYTSTTDDDDGLTFSTTSVVSNDLVRRKSSRSTHTKPHSATPPVMTPREAPPDHDYSTTAFWGWIILVITWLVFVVGMGSCFGVWSWAWDVGETPSAPPELEDDPSLPIVGYYPALIVMTGVMAWVWVVVAWVGMKYFRHARYGEE